MLVEIQHVTTRTSSSTSWLGSASILQARLPDLSLSVHRATTSNHSRFTFLSLAVKSMNYALKASKTSPFHRDLHATVVKTTSCTGALIELASSTLTADHNSTIYSILPPDSWIIHSGVHRLKLIKRASLILAVWRFLETAQKEQFSRVQVCWWIRFCLHFFQFLPQY